MYQHGQVVLACNIVFAHQVVVRQTFVIVKGALAGHLNAGFLLDPLPSDVVLSPQLSKSETRFRQYTCQQLRYTLMPAQSVLPVRVLPVNARR